MSSSYEIPQGWKGPRWWQNRSVDERRFHMSVPPRHLGAMNAAGSDYTGKDRDVLFTGPAGSGKTFRAVALAADTLQVNPLSARFVDSDDYIEMIKDSFNSDGELPDMYSTPHLHKLIKGVFDIVILDGLGQERQTDFAKHEIGTLLRHRHDNLLTTYITTTMSLVDIRNVYGERVSAVLDDMRVVKCSYGR